jgi:ribonuclease P protein component
LPLAWSKVLPEPHRLRRAADLARVRQHGRHWRHPFVTLIAYRNSGLNEANDGVNRADVHGETTASRFAFVAGRHIGSAVRRNRVKRRLREIVRAQLDQITPGWDCLLVARPAVVEAGFAELEDAIIQLFLRAGVLTDK